MPPSSVHFNGSVNLADAETVMREISARIPSGVRRMTDGETGERNYWIQFQVEKFKAMPELEFLGTRKLPGAEDLNAPPMPELRLAGGTSPAAVSWPDPGYASAYGVSFAVFDALQRDGVIGSDVRLQLQYPTPLAPIAGTISADDMPALAASYEAALFADLDRALGALPHDRIAVQWDVAVEFGLLEGGFGFDPAPLDQVVPGIVRCIERVPDDVPAGLHLCYGDYGHQHFMQPESLALQVRLVNAVSAAASRPVSWVAFTIPQSQRDPAYFEPLQELETGPETELDFALVAYHPAQQPGGTTEAQVELIDSNLARSPAGSRDWGVCTECGMGRVDSGEVPTLLDLHHEILQAHGQPSPA